MNSHSNSVAVNSGTKLINKAGPNPNQQAIALAYGAGDYAPKVVAKGRGLIAEQIIARAKEHNVFVHESKDLVALLMQVDLDDHIPPALYQAIAEVLAWLYRLEESRADAEVVVF
jgi:flagellar biosynthesis protein